MHSYIELVKNKIIRNKGKQMQSDFTKYNRNMRTMQFQVVCVE